MESEAHRKKSYPIARVRFSDSEIEYLSENVLGRIATVSGSMEPHVVPVVYRFDGNSVFFSGFNLLHSLKYRHIIRNNKVAFVVDDLESTRPWKPRGIEIRGYAEPIESGGHLAVKITPTAKRSWGIRR
jgi:pyridoxamine 5'-phosphate oxidase family protein